MGETTNKIASIFAEATANAISDEIRLSESEKMDEAIKAIKSIIDKAYAGAKIYFKAKRLHDILVNYSREDAILLIHEYVKKYEAFINNTTSITGRYVIYAKDHYSDKSDEYIQADIKFTILIVYFASITEEGLKIAIEKALKGIFRLAKD